MKSATESSLLLFCRFSLSGVKRIASLGTVFCQQLYFLTKLNLVIRGTKETKEASLKLSKFQKASTSIAAAVQSSLL